MLAALICVAAFASNSGAAAVGGRRVASHHAAAAKQPPPTHRCRRGEKPVRCKSTKKKTPPKRRCQHGGKPVRCKAVKVAPAPPAATSPIAPVLITTPEPEGSGVQPAPEPEGGGVTPPPGSGGGGAPAPPGPPTPPPTPAAITDNVSGDDWTLPNGVAPAANSGFFSESAEGNPDPPIDAHSFDITWRQIEPTAGNYSTTTTGGAYDLAFDTFAQQNANPNPFWLRLFASADAWAPTWIKNAVNQGGCGPVKSFGPDADGLTHLPIWNSCVWSKVREAWRWVMVTQNLRADPRLKFVYVPGAFGYTEFDYDMIDQGAKAGLTFADYRAWHQQMVSDLVSMMGPYAYKLMYTGEDYPFSEQYGDNVALFARDAVDAGMSIRNGITEVFNFHLNEVPAYGTQIAPNGHLATNDDWRLFDGQHIAAGENECYNACGFVSANPGYIVKMSNLRVLQMRMNWLYAVPTDSYFGPLRDHWRWVRSELGRRADNAPDAWVSLRDAEDSYWGQRGDGPLPKTAANPDGKWTGWPFVRNLERWITQRDIAPDGVARRGTIVTRNNPHPAGQPGDNGTAYESLRTDVARGQRALYFDADPNFLGAANTRPIQLKVTYLDSPGSAWHVEYRAAGGPTLATPTVTGTGTGAFRTVTFTINDAVFDGGLPGATDFALRATTGDLEASFVRIVKL